MHQFVEAGITLYNPDALDRPVNNPNAVNKISPECFALLRWVGTDSYRNHLRAFMLESKNPSDKYAKHREMKMIPLSVKYGVKVQLSRGKHSALIRAIWKDFGSRFVPGGVLVYAGDTGDKWGYFDKELLDSLGVQVDTHGKMPDVVIYCPKRNWLILAEAVTSHGPIETKRHDELRELFAISRAGLVFVSAFPDRRTMSKYGDAISWETAAWIADNPSHLIHFNGARFLGPYGP